LLKVDLNLLKVFHAIYTTGHLTRAGIQLGMTQPAMSHALRRLRALFDDDLFVRSAQGMVPTSRADELAQPVADGLSRIHQAVSRPTPFDPATTPHTFRLGISDYASIVLLPHVMARIRREAPLVDVRASPISSHRLGDLAWRRITYEQLEAGVLDLAIMHGRSHGRPFQTELLFSETAVCICATGNPWVGDHMTLETFLKLGHVKVSGADQDRTWVDELLGKRRLQRRVVLTLPHYAAAARVVADTDLVATLERRIARACAPPGRLRFLDPPFPSRQDEIVLVWHRRNRDHPGLRWLRATIRGCAAEL
jgi:DNA-binding transcriptional LysR family regulator